MIEKLEARKIAAEILIAAINKDKIVHKGATIQEPLESINAQNVTAICEAYKEIYNTVQKLD